MRLAYVCADAGVPVFGRKGCSIHAQEVMRAFQQAGWLVDLFAASLGGSTGDQLPVVRISPIPAVAADGSASQADVVATNLELRAALAAHAPYDLVYERYSLWSFAAMEYACAANIPGVLEVNAPLPDEQLRYRRLIDEAGARRAARRIFGAASTVVAVSHEVAEWVASVAPMANVHVVPNGVDEERFRPGVTPALPAPPGIFTFGFAGSLRPWHGLPTLIEACSQLAMADNQMRLLIVGDGPERESIRAALDRRQLLHTTVLTGAVDRKEMPALLASMDVGVAPYAGGEMFYFSPLKVYEYMAAGLPVVASEVGQLAELIHHDRNGLLVPGGDAVALAEALARLRNDVALRGRLGAAARADVLKAHTWAGVGARIFDLARSESSPAALNAPMARTARR